MRFTLAFVLLVVVSPPARADDPSPPAPMVRVADAAAVCAALADGLDPSLPCKSVGRVAMAGGAVAQLYQLDDPGFSRWMIGIDDHGTVSRSPWFGLGKEDCAMSKCTRGSGTAPKLRAVRGGKAVAVDLSARYTRTFTNPDSGKSSTASWQSYDLIACGANSSGTQTCVVRNLGDDGSRSCTGALAADGTITATCKETVSLD